MKAERNIFGKWLGLIVLSIFNFQFSIATAQELLNYPLDTVNGEEVYRYEVERSIGLYRIGVNFNVKQADIIRLNPQLQERGLHYGETLLLPTGRPVVIQPQEPEKKTRPIRPLNTDKKRVLLKDSAETVVKLPADSIITADTLAADSTLTDSVAPVERRTIELALMLPFESRQTKRSGNAERMVEFYQGAILALHALSNDSTLYRLRVYDTERSERRVNELCDSTELDSVRGILGLVYPIQIDRMAAWCDTNRVPLLLPFSNDFELAEHPQVLQFNSTDQQEADSLSAWLEHQDARIVAIEVRDADLASSVRTLRKQLKARGMSYSALSLSDIMNDSAAHALDSLKENIILLHSNRYQHIRMVLPHLEKLQAEGFRIRIISQYSWQKERINLPQVYTSMFAEETEHEAYEALWSSYYAGGHVSEMPRYDLLGYDLMQALVGWLRGEEQIQGLNSSIRWQQTGEGGWQNSGVRVVVKSER